MCITTACVCFHNSWFVKFVSDFAISEFEYSQTAVLVYVSMPQSLLNALNGHMGIPHYKMILSSTILVGDR